MHTAKVGVWVCGLSFLGACAAAKSCHQVPGGEQTAHAAAPEASFRLRTALKKSTLSVSS